MKKVTCKVCESEVTPLRKETFKQEYYLIGWRAYDVMDCPICGCQIVLGERLCNGESDDE